MFGGDRQTRTNKEQKETDRPEHFMREKENKILNWQIHNKCRAKGDSKQDDWPRPGKKGNLRINRLHGVDL